MKKLEATKIACRITDEVFSEILPFIKEGVGEKEIEEELEALIKQKGAKHAFSPHHFVVAFGKNSAFPHHKPSKKRLKKGEIILLDFGAKHNGFCADLSRTLFAGEVSAKQRRVYNLVLRAQKAALKKIEPGMRRRKADRIARSIISKAGYEKNFKHTLGHGIGKKVHLKGFRLGPKSRGILKVGSIFTIEPGIYIKGWGGIRIEDTVLLTEGGIQALTKAPKAPLQFPYDRG